MSKQLLRISQVFFSCFLLLTLTRFVHAESEEAANIVQMPTVVVSSQQPAADTDDASEAETEAGTEPDAAAASEPEAADTSATEAPLDVTPALCERFDAFRAQYNLTDSNFAVSYYNTVTGEHYDWNETHMIVAASTFKLPLNLYYYKLENEGEIAPDTLITQGGATLERCHYLSLVESNNELSNALLYRIGNFRDYKDAMRTFFTMTDEEIDAKYYQDNYYCTRMMMDTLTYLYDHADEFTEMIDYMKRSFPQNGFFRTYVTEMEVAHKYGSFEGAENDVGIFYAEQPFLLAVYTQNVGQDVVAQAARLAADYTQEQIELEHARQKQAELDAALAAFEAEKEARMNEAQQRAEAAREEQLRLWQQAQDEAHAEQARQEALAAKAAEDASAQQASQSNAQRALDFRFDAENFAWWMIPVALLVLLLGGGGIWLIVRRGKRTMKHYGEKYGRKPEK